MVDGKKQSPCDVKSPVSCFDEIIVATKNLLAKDFLPEAKSHRSLCRHRWWGKKGGRWEDSQMKKHLVSFIFGNTKSPIDFICNGFKRSVYRSIMIYPDLHYSGFIWVCLKIGYIPNYSHLIGIMISKTIGYNGVHNIFRHTQINNFQGTLFSDKPIYWKVIFISGFQSRSPNFPLPRRSGDVHQVLGGFGHAHLHRSAGTSLPSSWLRKKRGCRGRLTADQRWLKMMV